MSTSSTPKSQTTIKKKSGPTRGILDFIDIFMGRLSSRTNDDGERIRSWGVTYNMLMTIPAFVLVFAFSASILLASYRGGNYIPAKLVKAYMACVAKAKDVRALKTCPQVKMTPGRTIAAKVFDFGAYPWIAVLALAGLGFLGMIMRNRDDTKALQSLAEVAKVFVNKDRAVPGDLMSALSTQLTKLTGSTGADKDLSSSPGVIGEPKAERPIEKDPDWIKS